MPNKDISQLSKDLEQDMIRLRGKVASAMVQDLQAAGPWWTGHFATSWKISETPVEPVTKSKKRQKIDEGKIEGYDASLLEVMSDPDYTGSVYDQIKTTRRLPKRKRPKKVPLEKDLYVGNEAEYAGFAVNNPGATAPVGVAGGVTYYEHEQMVDEITPPSKNPDWYKIYMGNQQYNDAIALALAETFKAKNISFGADY
jgi:hypothetical protein|tara:strand:- start:1943 stop:2539 length:597 start_codon:yes stop_codon:yes gene_type:complete